MQTVKNSLLYHKHNNNSGESLIPTVYRGIVNIILEHLQCVIIQLWGKNASRFVGDSTILDHDLAKEAVRRLIAAS